MSTPGLRGMASMAWITRLSWLAIRSSRRLEGLVSKCYNPNGRLDTYVFRPISASISFEHVAKLRE
jgi:hypothetical protein